MNIRNYFIAVIAITGLNLYQLQAGPLALRSIAQKTASLAKNMWPETKQAVLETMQPYQTDLALLKCHVQGTSVDKYCIQPVKSIIHECMPNPITRKLVGLKACEWILSAPGFILAAKGDIQAVAGISMILIPHGQYGVAAAGVLVAGAASWYPWEFGLNQAKKLKETIASYDYDTSDVIQYA